MGATEIKTATITIKYVNAPKEGKSRGSIKGANNEFFGVPANKLSQFEPGMTYDIRYTQDGEWRTVVSGTLIEPERKSEPAATAGARTTPAASDANRATHPTDAERMWVCSLLNAAITSRVVDPRDPKALAEITMTYKRLWNYAFVANQSGEPAARGRMVAAE